jgi:hypothetical protein
MRKGKEATGDRQDATGHRDSDSYTLQAGWKRGLIVLPFQLPATPDTKHTNTDTARTVHPQYGATVLRHPQAMDDRPDANKGQRTNKGAEQHKHKAVKPCDTQQRDSNSSRGDATALREAAGPPPLSKGKV